VTLPGVDRAGRALAAMEEAGLDCLIVADLVNPGDTSREAQADVTWLTGFTGSSAVCLLAPDRRLLFTDSRYTERAAREVAAADSGFEVVTVKGRLVGEPTSQITGRTGFDPNWTSVAIRERMDEFVPQGAELVPVQGLISRLRRRKDSGEIERIAAAARLADQILRDVITDGVTGRSERQIALDIENRMRQGGATGPSFDTIVAAGPNAALPHHEPGDRVIAPGDVVLIDMGALLDGYCSDCTRTYVAGEPDGKLAEVYAIVLEAQLAALSKVAPGVPGKEVDAVAREIIAEAGYGDHFGHGLGHGVGIEIHESPGLSPRSDDILDSGDVVTVEPGIYLPGEFGVRIEDLVVLGDPLLNLSSIPKELTSI